MSRSVLFFFKAIVAIAGLLCLNSGSQAQTLVPLSGNNSVACGTNTTLYDHAGAATNYSNNANGYTVLDNSGTGVITLSGTYSTESGYDYVRIYSGSGTGGTLLYTYSGTGSITTFSSSAGQVLTVQFTSDVSITQAGFAIT
ncbi:MAG: hypothetical protein JNM49_06930, partial [Flavobacteriales bacterium]|nr:hypothetical protein [Flavobacteriales bacterium]